MPVTTSCKCCTADVELCAWLSQMLSAGCVNWRSRVRLPRDPKWLLRALTSRLHWWMMIENINHNLNFFNPIYFTDKYVELYHYWLVLWGILLILFTDSVNRLSSLGWVSDQINREVEVTRTLMPCPQLILTLGWRNHVLDEDPYLSVTQRGIL